MTRCTLKSDKIPTYQLANVVVITLCHHPCHPRRGMDSVHAKHIRHYELSMGGARIDSHALLRNPDKTKSRVQAQDP
jgi:hypothetical protein